MGVIPRNLRPVLQRCLAPLSPSTWNSWFDAYGVIFKGPSPLLKMLFLKGGGEITVYELGREGGIHQFFKVFDV